jgi:hypothetical protein
VDGVAEPFPGEGRARAAPLPAGAPPVPPPPTRWERVRPIAVPVLVAALAKVAVLLLAYLVLQRPDGFARLMAQAWDGAHYLYIADEGYQFRFQGEGDSVHFAFLYPMLIRLFGGSEAAALAINNVASLAAVAVVAWHWGPRPALALALFPSWLVYGSVAYSEGLFVLLAAVGLALVERGRGLAGGLAAGLAACARYLGGPALLLAMVPWNAGLRQGGWLVARRWVAFGAVSLAGLALAAWMWHQTGEPLGYYESQRPWGGKVAWPWEHFEWLLTGWFTLQGGPIAPWGNLSPIDFVVRDLLFLAPAVAGLALLWRQGRASPSFVFSLVVVLIAVCTSGTPAAALPRYLVAAFPAIGAVGGAVRAPWAWSVYVVVGVALATQGLAHHLFRYWS